MGWTREYREYNIRALVKQGGATYVKVEGTEIVEQDILEDLWARFRSQHHDLFRASDGLPALLKKTSRKGTNGRQDTYTETVIELLPE